MASKKSSSPATGATPTPPQPPPPPPASVSPSQSPFGSDRSLFMQRRLGMKTVATTPPPTTTLAPTPDPNEYEKSAYHNAAVTDEELSMLKEQVRLLNGLPPLRRKPLPRIKTLKPPKVAPRPTLTSRRRTQLQQRRMVVRCGGNLKEKLDEYERMTKTSDSALVYRRLRADAMAHTSEEMDLLLERRELDNLKYLAARAKQNEVVEYRDNQGSRLRFKHMRGEPIISSNFRDAYDDYSKPPFAVPHRIRQPKVYHLPKMDKKKEIWLVPVEDAVDIPLHTQSKTPDPKDKRTRREHARPPLRKGKRTPMAEWKDQKGPKLKRPPWNFAGSCPPNIGYSS